MNLIERFWRMKTKSNFMNHQTLIGHYRFLFNYFDPVKLSKADDGEQSQSQIQNRLNFLFPILVIQFTIIQALVGFESKEEIAELASGVSWHELRYFATHQVLPKEFWHISDVMILATLICVTSIYATLLIFPLLDQKSFLYIHERNVVIQTKKIRSIFSKDVSKRILSLRNRTKMAIKFAVLAYVIIFSIYFGGQIILNSSMVLTMRSFFFWIIIIPIFLVYCVYGNT